MNDTVKMTIRMPRKDAEDVKKLAKIDGYSTVNDVFYQAVRDLLANSLPAEPAYDAGANMSDMGGSVHKGTGKAGQ